MGVPGRLAARFVFDQHAAHRLARHIGQGMFIDRGHLGRLIPSPGRPQRPHPQRFRHQNPDQQGQDQHSGQSHSDHRFFLSHRTGGQLRPALSRPRNLSALPGTRLKATDRRFQELIVRIAKVRSDTSLSEKCARTRS